MLHRLRQMMLPSRWYFAAMLTCSLAGCDFPGRPNPAERPVTPEQVTDFDTLFQANCAGCHGAAGKLGPAPPLNDAIFLNIVPESELQRVISDGRSGTPMTAFARERGGTLNAAQVNALVAGLKSHWQTKVEVNVPLPSYLAAEGNTSKEGDWERGAKSFARACAVCHGEHGQGTTNVGAIHDPTFLGLISNQALRRLIITGRPDLGMPHFADHAARGADYEPLTSAEIDDLVALLSRWRQGSQLAAPIATSASTGDETTDSKGPAP